MKTPEMPQAVVLTTTSLDAAVEQPPSTAQVAGGADSTPGCNSGEASLQPEARPVTASAQDGTVRDSGDDAPSPAELLDAHMVVVVQGLGEFLDRADFASVIRTAFGADADPDQARVVLEGFVDSASGQRPQIQLIDAAAIGGADGAYAAATDTIYLSAQLLRDPSVAASAVPAVLVEEFGHALDVRLNDADTTGDEGAVFSALALGQDLSDADLALMRAEDDRRLVTIDGASQRIECATTNLYTIEGYWAFSDSVWGYDYSDVFVFTTTTTGTANDYIAIASSSGYVDLYLQLYDNYNNLLYSSGTAYSNSEAISLQGLPAGTYQAFVADGYNGYYLGYYGSAAYNVAINAPTAVHISPDALENNDSAALATPVDTGTLDDYGNRIFSGLTIHNQLDTDYFSFEITQTAGPEHWVVALAGDGTGGDIDLNLLNAYEQLVATTYGMSTGQGGNILRLNGLQPGRYYLQAGSYEQATTDDYSIGFALPQSLQPDAYDTGTGNNLLSTATPLGPVAGFSLVSGLNIHQSGDLDYFSFDLLAAADHRHEVTIGFDSGQADLDLMVFDTAGRTVGWSNGWSDTERVSLAGLQPGRYVAAVYAFDGRTADYDLSIQAPAGDGTIQIDQFDLLASNDSRTTATRLAAHDWNGTGFSAWEHLSIGPGDSDWFRFELPADAGRGTFVAAVFNTGDGDLDLTLYDASGTLVDAAQGLRDIELVDLAGRPAGTYYAQVAGFDGATNPSYTLALDVGGDDAFEGGADNNTPAGARVLPRTQTVQSWDASIGANDEDWYRLKLPSAGQTGDHVQISFSHRLGDLDLELYDTDGTTRLDHSAGVTDNERISLAGLAANTPGERGTFYYLRVYGYAGATNPSYELTIAAPVSDGADYLDAQQANNSLPSATYINDMLPPNGAVDAWQSNGNLSIHDGNDEDWFRFRLAAPASDGDVAVLSLDHTRGDLDLFLLDADGNDLQPGAGSGVANFHRIDLSELATGVSYYLKVAGHDDATNPAYSLSINAPLATADADGDLLEPSDKAQPRELSLNADGDYGTDNLSIHDSDDVDWYRFQTAATGRPGEGIGIAFSHRLGDLDMALYQADGSTLVDASVGVGDQEWIALNGVPAGSYLLKVYGFDPDGDGPREGASNPNYSLIIDGPAGSVGDWAEAHGALAETGNNDSRAHPTDLRNVEGSQRWDDLSLHERGDVDWYRFRIANDAAPGNQAWITFDQTQGDLDLYLYDSTGTELLGQSETNQDIEQVDLTDANGIPLAAGTYLIKVAGYQGAANPSYRLGIDAPTATQPDWAEGAAGNNVRTAATDLQTVQGTAVFGDLTLHAPGDEDWFKLQTVGDGGAGHSVSIVFDNQEGDLDLALYNAVGFVADSTSDSDRERISLDGQGAGTYYVRVYGADAGTTSPDYTLAFDAPQTAEPDFTEDHDSFANPYDLREVTGTLQLSGLSIDSPSDVDWFKFTLERAPTATESVRITFDSWAGDVPQGDLSLALYDVNQQLLVASDTGRQAEEIDLTAHELGLGSGTYFVEVSSADHLMNPNYTLIVGGNPDLVQDFIESNDAPDSAYDLRHAQDARFALNRAFYGVSPGYSSPLGEIIPVLGMIGEQEAQHVYSQDVPAWSIPVAFGQTSSYPANPFSNVSSLLAQADQAMAQGTAIMGVGPTHTSPTLPFSTSTLGVGDQNLNGNYAGYGYGFGSVNPYGYGGTGSGYTLGSINPYAYGGTGSGYTLGSVNPYAYGGTGNGYTLGSVNPYAYGGTGSGYTLGSVNPYAYGGTGSGYTLGSVNPYGYGGDGGLYQLGSVNPFNAGNWNPYRAESSGVGAAIGLSDLSIHHVEDQDWFRFELAHEGAEGQSVSISFDHDQGDLMLELYEGFDPSVYATEQAYGQWLVDRSNGQGNSETISLTGLAQGSYFVRVQGVGGATSPGYDLTITAPLAGDAQGDWAEGSDGNETRADAHNLRHLDGTQVLTGLSIHTAGDQDWFGFDTARQATASNRIRIDFGHASGDLDLALFDAAGTELARSEGTGNYEELSLLGPDGSGLAAGTYYVQVYGYDGATNPDYSLTIAAPSTSIGADALEPNNAFATATRLDLVDGVSQVSATIHSGDVDFYRFAIPVEGDVRHSIDLRFDQADGALAMELFRDSTGNGNFVSLGVTPNSDTGHLSFSLNGLQDGSYWAKVQAANGDADVENSYQLRLDTPTAGTGETAAPDDWTVLVYITASDLAAYGFLDVNEMEQAVAGLSNRANIVVLWDQSSLLPTYATGGSAPWGDTRQAVIVGDTNAQRVVTPFERPGEQNTGDPETLKEFLTTGIEAAPADHYALVLWDHGGGSLGGFNVDDEGSDNSPNKDRLRTDELVSALQDIEAAGHRMDLIAFDSCLMANAEVVYELGNYTDVVVSSEESIAGYGYNYSTAFAALAGDASRVTPIALASSLIDSYQVEYQYDISGADTLSAADTSQLGAFATALRGFTTAAVADTSPALWNALYDARAASSSYGAPYADSYNYRDLGQFLARVVATSSISQGVRTAAEQARAALGAVIVDRTSDGRASEGLSIYFPTDGRVPSTYGTEHRSFLQATGWAGFLVAMADHATRDAAADADWAGANNIAARAHNLRTLAGDGWSFDGLNLAAGDLDWFRFRLVEGGGSGDRVTLDYDATGGARAALTLYAAGDRSTPLATASGALGDQWLDLGAALADGEYLLKIENLGDTGIAGYALGIDAPGAAGDALDWSTGNRSVGKAEDLGLIADDAWFTGLYLAASGSDWFTFEVPKQYGAQPGQVLVHANDDSALSVALFDAEGYRDGADPLATATSSGDLSLEYPGNPADSYLLRIDRPAGLAATAYTLVFTGVEQAPQNTIVGTNGPDTLSGTAGNDVMLGLAGDDRLQGLGGADLLVGEQGSDVLDGGTGDDRLYGGSGADELLGGDGNDRLAGGFGADRMEGGSGDDIYVVTDVDDRIVELGDLTAGGHDRVEAALSHRLEDGVEDLVLTGTAATAATGNALANLITGNSASNRIDGGAGDDRLLGMDGDDELLGGAGNDVLEGGDGDDRLSGQTGGDRLDGGAGDDRLDGGSGDDVLIGRAGRDQLAGAAGADTLSGGDGDDRLSGGAGNDQLFGGNGADAFRFERVDDGADQVLDFTPGTDRIEIVSRNFGDLPVGTLEPGRFIGDGAAPTQTRAVFIYDPSNGSLAFDSNGSGSGGLATLAVLVDRPALAAGDIHIVTA